MSAGLFVNTNVASINAQKNLSSTTRNLSKSFERLSSGFRINKASDDAAGISVSENLRKQIRGTQQGTRNAADALSMANILDAGIGEITNILQRMRELAVQAANGTYSTTERGYLQNEFDELRNQIEQIADTTEYNGVNIMNSGANTLSFQIGFSTSQVISTFVFDEDYQAAALDIAAGTVSVGAQSAAQFAISAVDSALTKILGNRAEVGAFMNRMESVISYDQAAIENMSAAERQIRETDFASETASLSRYQILQQAGTSVLSQANASTQSVLALLQ